MESLDITSIVISCITLLTLLVNVVYNCVRNNQNKDINNDKRQWETIDKLITGLLNKQEEMCKTLTKMFRRIKKLEKE